MLKGAHLPIVYHNGVLVKQVDSVKYLGHFPTCDDIYIFVDNVVCLTFVVILYFENFICLLCLLSYLKLFNYCCSSLYTPHLWWNYKKMSMTKLQITYHNILKRKIGLSKYESTNATCAFTNTQCCQSTITTIRNLVFKIVCTVYTQ